MGRSSNTHGGQEMCIKDFGGKPEERRPLERPRRRWVDNIKMELRVVGWGNGFDLSCSG